MTQEHSACGSQIHLGYYIVGLVDVLNQRGHLENLEHAHATNDSTAVFSCMRSTVGTIRGIRENILSFSTAFLSADGRDLATALDADARAHFLKLTQCQFHSQHFSDTSVVFAPLINDNVVAMKSVWGVMCGLSTLMITTLCSNIAIRGAIEIGVGTNAFPDQIYGPVLARTYRLEQNVAEYPRIVIGPQLQAFLKHTATKPLHSPTDHIYAEMADLCLQMIVEDTDHCAVLNYFNSQIESASSTSTHLNFRTLVPRAVSFADKEFRLHTTEGNTKLAARYERLLKFLNRHAEHMPK